MLFSVVQFTLENFGASLGEHAGKLIEAGVEQQVLAPRYASMIALSRPRCERQELRLHNLRTLVRGKSQQFFGIAEDLVSPQLEYCAARGYLQDFSSSNTPTAELTCLVNCATAIYRETQVVTKRRGGTTSPKVVGADEFTPIFVFVVCRLVDPFPTPRTQNNNRLNPVHWLLYAGVRQLICTPAVRIYGRWHPPPRCQVNLDII